MNIEPRDVDALVEIFESSDWEEMHLRIGDFELYLATDPAARLPRGSEPGPGVPRAAASEAPRPQVASAPDAAAPAAPGPAEVPAHWVAVRAPNLGTFYRAPKPGSPPFVAIGDRVGPDTEICLIEVMKLFTAMKAGVGGIVRRACVEDAVMVEFGDVLFYVDPA